MVLQILIYIHGIDFLGIKSREEHEKQRDSELLKIALGFKEAIEKNIDKPIQFLRALMSQKVASAFNNSLDKLSQDEIIELIKDQNLVNLLDELDQHHGPDIKG